MVNNSNNINQSNNNLSLQIIEYKKTTTPGVESPRPGFEQEQQR